jgi:hypothetical protein
MKNPRSEQNHFFELVQERLEEDDNFVDKVAEVLNLSRDSSYRRLKGITDLSLKEMVILARYFGLALNKIMGEHENAVVFSRRPVIQTIDDFKNHLLSELQELEKIATHSSNQIHILAKDIPFYHLYSFPKLAAFQIYVCLKSACDIKKIEGLQYDLKEIPQDLLEITKRQEQAFSKINSLEIWNDATVLSLIHQIEYYHEAGLLSSKKEALDLCDEMHLMMKHIYRQGIEGKKTDTEHKERFTSVNYRMHYHEVLPTNNHILVEHNKNQRRYIIPYAGVNTLQTSDPLFTKNIAEFLRAQTKKSSLINDISEKERNKFFIRIQNRIDRLKSRIEQIDPFM